MRNKWTQYEDMSLAVTILDHVKKGNTYKDAFVFASTISRTASACKNRWYRKVKDITNEILNNKQNPNIVSKKTPTKNNIVLNLKQKVGA